MPRAAALGLLSGSLLLVVLRLLPEGARSADMNTWLYVADELRRGGNPYNSPPFLNWPPLWMQVIALLNYLSPVVHLRLARVIQLTLVGIHASVVVVTYLLLRRFRVRRPALLVLVGLMLAPVAVLLTTVHGNFDALVGLLALVTVWLLCRWVTDARPEYWHWACLVLGVAVLAKTVPIVLAPLLFISWDRLSPAQRLLGAALLLGPVALGMSVILSLGPQQVIHHVIEYRSLAGYFGPTGLIAMVRPDLNRVYALAFIVGIAAVMAIVGRMAWMGRLDERRLVVAGAFLLLLVPAVGPGFGNQYLWWSLPLLTVAFALEGWMVRGALAAYYVVASATFIVGYALNPSLGQVARIRPHPAIWDDLARMFYGDPARYTLTGLPLWLTMLAVLMTMTLAALRPSGTPRPLARTQAADERLERAPAPLSQA